MVVTSPNLPRLAIRGSGALDLALQIYSFGTVGTSCAYAHSYALFQETFQTRHNYHFYMIPMACKPLFFESRSTLKIQNVIHTCVLCL